MSWLHLKGRSRAERYGKHPTRIQALCATNGSLDPEVRTTAARLSPAANEYRHNSSFFERLRKRQKGLSQLELAALQAQ